MNTNADWVGNKNSIWKTLGASNHTDKERQMLDYYATDPIAVEKLIKAENINSFVWECACGQGHLSKKLKELGYDVYSTDIIDRGYEHFNGELDFLFADSCFNPFGDYAYDIVTNPPYKYAKEFVLKALSLLSHGSKACFFLKVTFLEGKARFKEIFNKFPPKCVYVFSERCMCAKNGDFAGMQAGGGSAVAYAWFVWQKGYTGASEVKWI